MTPDQALREIAEGTLRPIYLVLGEERLFADEVVAALRAAATAGGIAGFNDDKMTAGEQSVDAVVSAAKMMPMMAKRRFVLVRSLERWEKKGAEEAEDDDASKGKGGVKDAGPLDVLADYAKDPSPSTVLVLAGTKIHGSRRLVTTAKKAGWIVQCDPLHRRDLPSWIEREAKRKGHAVTPDIADLLAELMGPELGPIADAVERLSLFVGPGRPISEDAVARIVTRVRQSTVWELTDALCRRRSGVALAVLSDAYDPRDGGLKLLGAVAWSVRQLVKLDSALRAGASPAEAAARAGVAPFKANESAQTVKRLPRGTLEGWLRLLAEADVALKSSRRPALAILEEMVLGMCHASAT